MIDRTLAKDPTETKEAKEPIEPTEKAELIEPMLMNEFLEAMLNAEFLEAILQREFPPIPVSGMLILSRLAQEFIMPHCPAMESATANGLMASKRQ